MGHDPSTMVGHGVIWAEDQDPFGHVMRSQYMQSLDGCFHRVMESYDAFLSEDKYNGMITGTTVIPVIRKYELAILRQVKYSDAVDLTQAERTSIDTIADYRQLISAYREERTEPMRNIGTTSLFLSNSGPLLPS